MSLDGYVFICGMLLILAITLGPPVWDEWVGPAYRRARNK